MGFVIWDLPIFPGDKGKADYQACRLAKGINVDARRIEWRANFEALLIVGLIVSALVYLF
jgi:hypothetical protein